MDEKNYTYKSLYIEIPSDDYEKSISFYEGLDFHVTHDIEMADGSRKLYMQHTHLSAVSIEFLKITNERKNSNNSIRFNVEKIDDLLEKFENLPKDRISVSEVPYAKMATLIDPCGFKIHIIEFFVDE